MAAQLLEFVDAKHELIPEAYTEESILYGPMYDLAGMFIPAVKAAGEQIMEQSQYL